MAKRQDKRGGGHRGAAKDHSGLSRSHASGACEAPLEARSQRLAAAGDDNWTGARKVLAQLDYVNMPQTPNASLIVGYINQDKSGNEGQISVSTGGSPAQVLPVPALTQMLSLLINNWQANNLQIVNMSIAGPTPIMVQAFGPGLPGIPIGLPIGQSIQLGVAQAAQGPSKPRNMLLRLTASTGNLSIVGIVGGELDTSGNNAYVIALNSPAVAVPPGYFAVTPGNSFTFPFNWSGGIVYVVNLSPVVAATVSVTMTAL